HPASPGPNARRFQSQDGRHARCQGRRVSLTSSARSRLASAAEYVPRRPHDTVLYGIVRKHLATFLAYTERTYAAPLPKHVVVTWGQSLACGGLAGGFVRCHCDGCGHDVLVA